VYDRFLAYRKGPFAMYALREYLGADRVSTALRRLFQAHSSAAPLLPTSLDLYHELQAVTPDSLRYLLVDLFEANTFWELETKHVAMDSVAADSWRVTLDVSARKVVVDTAGVATDVPMNDLIEVGVFGEKKGGRRGQPLYLRMHRIRSGEQRIVLTVPRRPAEGGIDPRHLLIDTKVDDNLKSAEP
jgi:ABC-2 type transport system permease protein